MVLNHFTVARISSEEFILLPGSPISGWIKLSSCRPSSSGISVCQGEGVVDKSKQESLSHIYSFQDLEREHNLAKDSQPRVSSDPRPS